MENRFLAVDKRLLQNTELMLLEKLIISQIQEFTKNSKECYMTDKQFADAFGVNTQQVTRAIKRLADAGVIVRDTKVVSNNGQASKRRILKALIKNDYCFESTNQNDSEAIVKNDESTSQNDNKAIVTSDDIIDNRKDNVKDNRIENAVAIEAMDINGYCLESNGQNSTEAMDAGVQIIDNRKDNIKDNRIDKAVSESLMKKIKSIGIDVKQNTINAIVQAAGDTDINQEAISNIIDVCSEEGMFHGNSGYNFIVLRNQISDRYAEVNEFIRTQKEEEAEKKRKQEEINQQIRAAQPEIEQNREQLTALCCILFPERQVDDMLLAGALRYSEKIEDVGAFVDYHNQNPNLSIKCKGFQQRYNTESICRDDYVNPIDCYIKYVQEDMRYHEQIIGA